ncbi:OLC1v1022248C1 [Oldenlandia corymbosa var. corymbosa]|uniref:OLC1v1022248C1 n=1 Tax=Oldenlandia corymbosa var. corymbosa TaxID=529605 RepID=A0AAV1BXF5_OLDCO|nr:OLC1v1022248C1 [Oldenlandia corymbosa var. corymbosa]
MAASAAAAREEASKSVILHHGSSPPPQNPYPYLAFVHGEEKENQTFYDVTSSEPETGLYPKSIPEFKNEPEVISSQGWLILYHLPEEESSSPMELELQLLNPLTSESFHLPPLTLRPTRFLRVILTKPPTDPDSVILVFATGRPHPPCIIFRYVQDEEEAWTYRSCDKDFELIDPENPGVWHWDLRPVLCKDRIYVQNCRSEMAEIEIVKPRELVIRPFDCDPPPSYSLGSYRYITDWAECCGDLFMVKIELGGMGFSELISVTVFQLNFVDLVWDVVHSRPDVAFFLSWTGGQAMACPIASPDSDRVGNRVYFVTQDEENNSRSFYTYHIERKTLLVSLLSITKLFGSPLWIHIPDAQAIAKAKQEYQTYCETRKVEEPEKRLSLIRGPKRVSLKNKEAEEEKGDSAVLRTRLDGLPVALLGKIICSHLVNPVDYLSFRSVSKLYRSMFPTSEWKIRASTRDHLDLQSNSTPPFLLTPSMVEGVSYMLDSVTQNMYYMRLPQIKTSGEDFRIVYSAYGWLLMAKKVYSEERGHKVPLLKLYNPLTKSTICLPELPEIMINFFLSASPASPNCTVYAISTWERVFYSIRLGGDMSNWVQGAVILDLENEDNSVTYAEQSHTYAVYLDRCFYIPGGDGELRVYRLEDSGNYAFTMHDLKLPFESSSLEQNFLVECGGDVVSVMVGECFRWLKVFKLNRSELGWEWEEVKDLKDKNLYLSTMSAVIRDAEIPKMGNRIYLPRFYQDSIVYYSLNTCKFHCSNSKEDEEDEDAPMCYNGSEEQLYCCWFEPSCN